MTKIPNTPAIIDDVPRLLLCIDLLNIVQLPDQLSALLFSQSSHPLEFNLLACQAMHIDKLLLLQLKH